MKSLDSSDRGFSRRSLLLRSGVAALGSVSVVGAFSAPAGASAEGQLFSDSSEVDELLVGAIREVLAENDLPTAADIDPVVVGVEITEPRTRFVIDLRSGRTSVLANQSGENTNCGVVVSSVVAHELIAGQVTFAHMLATDQISLFGHRPSLAPLRLIPHLAGAVYERKLRVAGKDQWLSSTRDELI